MSTYTHLTQKERYHIETMLKQNFSLTSIAKGMGRNKGTLSRELKRNHGQRGYRHQQADKMAKQRHHDKPKAIKLDQEMQQLITPLIQENWSPEQISGRLKQEGKKSVSHETIYRFFVERQGGRRRVVHAPAASSQAVSQALWQEGLSRHHSSPRGY
jgi:transposase, IS30 family